MNTNKNADFDIARYLLPALAAAVTLIVGVVWFASSPGARSSVPTTPRLSASFAPSQGGSGPYSYVPQSTPEGGVPQGGVPQSVPRLDPSIRFAPIRRSVNTRDSGVRDMFPVGDIVNPRAVQPYAQARPEKLAPNSVWHFQCVGKTWAPTKGVARADELQLTPTGVRLNGRTVYALVGSDAGVDMLFVQSASDPDKYVIFRQMSP